MRDTNSNILPRRQNIERKALAPLVGVVDEGEAEPAFSARLCEVIVAYWRAQGHQVKAWVERGAGTQGAHAVVYQIRSHGIPVRGA